MQTWMELVPEVPGLTEGPGQGPLVLKVVWTWVHGFKWTNLNPWWNTFLSSGRKHWSPTGCLVWTTTLSMKLMGSRSYSSFSQRGVRSQGWWHMLAYSALGRTVNLRSVEATW